MRRRFGRRRTSAQEARAVDPAVLGRIVEIGLIPVASLEPIGAEGVPASLAALGSGSGEAGRHLVAFAPQHAVDALLSALALGLRLNEQEGFEGRVHALSPRWSEEARRLLARFPELPFTLEPLEAPMLAPGSPVVATGAARASVVPLEALLRQSADGEQRALLGRVAEALAGLAAKHGGAVRGHGDALELVVLARRMAALRVQTSGLVLECSVPQRKVLSIEPDGISEALDGLEGAMRKHLHERRVREGEEGLRGRVLDALGGDGSLRCLVRWPCGGTEPDVIDFAALDADGVPYLGAVRRQLTLEELSAILRAGAALEPFLPLVFAHAEPPVRIAAPGLWLAAAAVDAAAQHVLDRWSDGLRCFSIEQPGARKPELSPLLARSARLERPAAPPRSEDSGRQARSRSGARGARRRSEPREPARGGQEAPGAPGFEEVSLFELDEEVSGPSDRDGRARRRRRGRGRRGRRGDAREPGGDARERGGDSGGEEVGSRGPGRRGEGPRSSASRPPSETEEEGEEDLTLVEEEDGPFVHLVAPDAPEPEPEAPSYEDEEEEATSTPAPAGEPAAAAEPAPAPRPPRRRTAIVAHADRGSLAAAVLLARDVRLLEGIWIYAQSELMTFFRSVATDLREDAAVCVVGFTPSPARDVIQAAALYSGRISWFDHHDWPPEDREALRAAIDSGSVFHQPGGESSLAAVLETCSRRSRFSDKLVDLVTSRFSQHDYERWGRLWWWRLGEMASRSGEHRAELELLLAGRPSDLARAAARAEPPPLPAEANYAAQRDFRVVHFGGYALVVVPVPRGLDLYLTARIVRERYGARLSLAHPEGGQEELLVLGADEAGGRRSLDLRAMVEHLSGKFAFVEALSDADHVARLRVRGLHGHPERFDEILGEIAMGRSILEG